MSADKVLSLLLSLIGLYCAIRFRYIGKVAIKQRKQLNKYLPFRQPDSAFDESAVFITQIMFLIIGMLMFLVGLLKFLSK